MKTISIADRFKSKDPILSAEFYPPKSDQAAQSLLLAAKELQSIPLDFVSITYGAGGSTRSRTLKYASQLRNDFGYEVMPHLTCVGHSRDELQEIIKEFKTAGFNKIMALRGDPPKGQTDFKAHPDGLSYANELVHLIGKVFPECSMAVAGYPEKHPECTSSELDLLNLKRKVDAGATFVTTQLFYDNTHYFNFVDKCRSAGITLPILPGLMSITSRDQAIRFCAMCGTSIPQALDDALLAAGDDADAVEKIGIDWTFEQAKQLLVNNAPGVHLYILNRSAPALQLVQKLQDIGFYRS